MNDDFQSAWLDHNTRLIDAERSRRFWRVTSIALAAIGAGILAFLIVQYALIRAIAEAATLPTIMMF